METLPHILKQLGGRSPTDSHAKTLICDLRAHGIIHTAHRPKPNAEYTQAPTRPHSLATIPESITVVSPLPGLITHTLCSSCLLPHITLRDATIVPTRHNSHLFSTLVQHSAHKQPLIASITLEGTDLAFCIFLVQQMKQKSRSTTTIDSNAHIALKATPIVKKPTRIAKPKSTPTPSAKPSAASRSQAAAESDLSLSKSATKSWYTRSRAADLSAPSSNDQHSARST